MISEKLFNYIKECRNKNMSDKEISDNLSSHGWPIGTINEALYPAQQATPFPPLSQQPVYSPQITTTPPVPPPITQSVQVLQTSPTKQKKKTNWLKIIGLFFLVLVILSLISTGIFYYVIIRPRVILASSITKTANSSSFTSQINFESLDKFLSNIAVNIEKNGQISKIIGSLSVQKDSISPVENITLSSIISPEYYYYKPQKSNSAQTLNQLLTDYPQLSGMKGFGIVQPVLFGNFWLREKNSSVAHTKEISPLEQVLIGTIATFPFTINSLQNSYEFNGENYKKIVIGINKDLLINYLTDSKTSSNYFTDSDKINFLNVIKNTNGWDKDILEILVNNKGYATDIILKLPKLAGDVKTVSFNDLQESKINITEYIYQTLINYTNQQTPIGENIKIAEVKFSNFEENIGIDIPTNIVDFDSQTKESQDAALFTIYSIIFDQKLSLASNNQSNLFSTKSHETKLLFDKGDYSQTLTSANELLKLASSDSDKAISYYWIGLAYYSLKNIDLAEQNLNQALSLNSKYGAPYVTLAAISYQKGDYQTGLNQSLKCAEAEPDYAWCYNDIGLGYLYLGNRDLGIQNLEKAVTLDPLTFVFSDNLNRAKKNQ